MRCPHCSKHISSQGEFHYLTHKPGGHGWGVHIVECPECSRKVLFHVTTSQGMGSNNKVTLQGINQADAQVPPRMFEPRSCARPCPPEVRAESASIASDFEESCLVLNDSPKASAALARRCLQNVIREKLGINAKRLYDEIGMAMPRFPLEISDLLHTVREVGNLAAHPMADVTTGVIVDVEPGEAELLVDVLEAVFDELYVRPAALKRQKAAIDAKLKNLKR